jgi:hypothetical protein
MLISAGVKPKGRLYMHYVITRAFILLMAASYAILPSAAEAGKKKPGGAAGTGGTVKTEDLCEKEKVQKCTTDKDGIKTCVWVDGTKCRIY